MAKAAKKKPAGKKATRPKSAGKKAAAKGRLRRSASKPAKRVAKKTATKAAPKKKVAKRASAKKAAAKAPARRASTPAKRRATSTAPVKHSVARRLRRGLPSDEPKLPSSPLAPARKTPSRKRELALPVPMPLDEPLRPDDMRSASQSYGAVRLIDKE